MDNKINRKSASDKAEKAIHEARNAVNKRKYKLQFDNYPEKLQKVIRSLQLDPEHRFNGERVECAMLPKQASETL